MKKIFIIAGGIGACMVGIYFYIKHKSMTAATLNGNATGGSTTSATMPTTGVPVITPPPQSTTSSPPELFMNSAQVSKSMIDDSSSLSAAQKSAMKGYVDIMIMQMQKDSSGLKMGDAIMDISLRSGLSMKDIIVECCNDLYKMQFGGNPLITTSGVTIVRSWMSKNSSLVSVKLFTTLNNVISGRG